MGQSKKDKLHRFYHQIKSDDHVLIVINADPDAIACAMAVKRLLWRKSSSVTISHVNAVERPDNLSMINRLGLKMMPFHKTLTENHSKFIMVDSQPSHHEAFQTFNPDIIIDHHPNTGASAGFTDIRSKYGAAATILTEYLRTAKIKPSTRLAGGLFYAIKTDTRNFQRQTVIEDIRAFQFLYRHANAHLVMALEQKAVKYNYLKYFQEAINKKIRRRGRLYVHLGKVRNPDVCVIIADFFLGVETVQWSIVSGIHGGTLTIIFRNDGLRKNAGRLAEQGFGNIGSAGGHKSMARAEIKLNDIKEQIDLNDEKKMSRWIVRRVEKRYQTVRKGSS